VKEIDWLTKTSRLCDPCQLAWQVKEIERLTQTTRLCDSSQLAWQVKEIARLLAFSLIHLPGKPAVVEGVGRS